MGKRFVDDAARTAFADAIRSIEARSSAEVIIKVRHHSGTYLHADIIAGVTVGLAALAFMLFSSRFEFSTTALLVDPILVGIGFGLFTTQLPLVRRLLTLPSARRERVRTGAQAGFYQRGIRMTSGRTGILVYLSLLERSVELVCDSGVTAAVDERQLDAARDHIEAALHRRLDGVEVAKAIESLGDRLEGPLPCSEDDVNELPDEVHHP